MINILFILFSILVLSYNNILLFNEETLIFLCFTIFISLIYYNFSNDFSSSLKQQSINIKLSLEYSLKNQLIYLNKFTLLTKKTKDIYNKISLINFYYKNLSILLSNLLLKSEKYQLILSYKKRLIFINKVEQYTIKLLAVVISKKLINIIKLKNFYTQNLKTSYFLCTNLIYLREQICLISNNKLV